MSLLILKALVYADEHHRPDYNEMAIHHVYFDEQISGGYSIHRWGLIHRLSNHSAGSRYIDIEQDSYDDLIFTLGALVFWQICCLSMYSWYIQFCKEKLDSLSYHLINRVRGIQYSTMDT